MRSRLLVVGLLVLSVAGGSTRSARRCPTRPDLPVRRVILYKSGVGFFEHLGSVTGNTAVTIQFTTAQLNDVLQSLTALDLDGGSIASISYNSIAPIDQRLSACARRSAAMPTGCSSIEALRGARVVVRTGASEVERAGSSASSRSRGHETARPSR